MLSVYFPLSFPSENEVEHNLNKSAIDALSKVEIGPVVLEKKIFKMSIY